jgi:hypothetical protein
VAFSAKEKQYAMIAGGLVGAVLLWTVVIDPFVNSYQDTKQKVVKVKDDLNQAEDLFRTEKQKTQVWQTMRTQGLKTSLEDSQSQAMAAVQHWADSTGVTVAEMHSEGSPKQDNKFQISSFRFTVTGAMEQGTVPASDKSKVPGRIPLRIDELDITPRTKPGTDDLRAQVTVSTLSLISDGSMPDVKPAAGASNAPKGAQNQ